MFMFFLLVRPSLLLHRVLEYDQHQGSWIMWDRLLVCNCNKKYHGIYSNRNHFHQQCSAFFFDFFSSLTPFRYVHVPGYSEVMGPQNISTNNKSLGVRLFRSCPTSTPPIE